jgi:Skp family chaperone for outer membrane proteins
MREWRLLSAWGSCRGGSLEQRERFLSLRTIRLRRRLLMMRMLRRFGRKTSVGAVTLALLVTPALTGCGSTSAARSTKTQTPAERKLDELKEEQEDKAEELKTQQEESAKKAEEEHEDQKREQEDNQRKGEEEREDLKREQEDNRAQQESENEQLKQEQEEHH